jgi:hypothetical protein
MQSPYLVFLAPISPDWQFGTPSTRQHKKCLDIVHLDVAFANAEMDVLSEAMRPQPQRQHINLPGVLFYQPARHSGHASVTRDHLEHDVRRLDCLVTFGRNARRDKELHVDVEPVSRNGIRDQHFIGQLIWFHVANLRQMVISADGKHLFVIKDWFEWSPCRNSGSGVTNLFNLVVEERPDAAELKFLLHVHV